MNKNALTPVSLACLKIRSRNEEAMILHETGFTKDFSVPQYFIDGRIFFKICTFYLFLN